MGATWETAELVKTFHFFLDACYVQNSIDKGKTEGVPIINSNCYSKLVNAEPIGSKHGEKVGFSYEAFVYSGEKEQAQTITCTVKFCLIESCENMIITDTADCPEGPYEYSAT